MWSTFTCYLVATSVGNLGMTALYLRMNPNGGLVGRPCGVGIDLSSILYGVSFLTGSVTWPFVLCALLYRARKERQLKQYIEYMSY